jgi:hypothetical protein
MILQACVYAVKSLIPPLDHLYSQGRLLLLSLMRVNRCYSAWLDVPQHGPEILPHSWARAGLTADKTAAK